MSHHFQRYDAAPQRNDFPETPFIPDTLIAPVDRQLSADQRMRMRTFGSDGDPVGLYFGHPIAQTNILVQENAAQRLAREQPQLYGRLALTPVISYNSGQVARDSDGLRKKA